MDSPGLNAICPICFWEDDVVQLRWPDWTHGSNTLSLIEAQSAYAATGACGPGAQPYVRRVTADDEREPGWRPINPAIDAFEPCGEENAPWPTDVNVLYWWRRAFWRVGNSHIGASKAPAVTHHGAR